MGEIVAGVDGCPAGWIAVLWAGPGSPATHILCPSFADVMALEAKIIAVDMPIGLPARHGRPAEREVRAKLGQRQSSVFAVPARASILASDYRDACRINLLHSDLPRKIAKQCFHLFEKIREIDALMCACLQSRVFESHPELAFWAMNDQNPVPLPKKVKSRPYEPGLVLRRELLASAGFPIASLPETTYRRSDVGADDLIDACACAVVARRIRDRENLRFPQDPPCDAKGLRMEINC